MQPTAAPLFIQCQCDAASKTLKIITITSFIRLSYYEDSLGLHTSFISFTRFTCFAGLTSFSVSLKSPDLSACSFIVIINVYMPRLPFLKWSSKTIQRSFVLRVESRQDQGWRKSDFYCGIWDVFGQVGESVLSGWLSGLLILWGTP